MLQSDQSQNLIKCMKTFPLYELNKGENKIFIANIQISSYCRGDPIFTLADADDLQIVCGEFSVESPEPEFLSNEREAVLDIKKIINHPDYRPNGDPGVGGPIEGSDICVYIVDQSEFTMGNYLTLPFVIIQKL